MNKLQLFVLVVVSAIFIQSCKKSTENASAVSTAPLLANIDGITWTPDTISNTITYNSANKTKTFNCIGTKDSKQVILTVILNNAGNSNGFATGTFAIDSVSTIAQYNTLQKNESGDYVYLPHGAVSPGSGTIVVSAVDSVKKQITGTFTFYSRTTNRDDAGNVISINVDNIYGGVFRALPYTFISN